ncbi:MAG: hypothetical protein LBD51_00855, partial [Bifidobacteriaceae bacterium]|nr:hypothetical protein [Bifidobacteriaceae bacterium]
AAPGARFLLLVKPQFEVGRAKLPAGGVVVSPRDRADAIVRVAGAGAELGLGAMAVVRSPLPGPAGNVEFFCDLRAGAPGLAPAQVAQQAARAAQLPDGARLAAPPQAVGQP